MFILLVFVFLMTPIVSEAQEGKIPKTHEDVAQLAASRCSSCALGDISEPCGNGIAIQSQSNDPPDRTADRQDGLSGVLSEDLFASEPAEMSHDTLAADETRFALGRGLFSLLIPGTGQLANRNFIKAAGFLSAEIIGWAVNAIYNEKGTSETKAFQIYADGTAANDYRDGHYSVVRYALWIQKNLAQLMSQQGTPADNQAIANQYASLMVVNNGNPAPWEQVNWYALNKVENAIGGYFSHWLFGYPNVEYYKEIGKYPQFRQGWDDENPSVLDYNTIRNDTPHSAYYENMRGIATGYYNIAMIAAGAIIANHFASALEAALWAHSHYRPIGASITLSPLSEGTGYLTEVNLAIHF